jgi:hypothetical protein
MCALDKVLNDHARKSLAMSVGLSLAVSASSFVGVMQVGRASQSAPRFIYLEAFDLLCVAR